MKSRLDLNRLPVQMILSFIAVVLLTSAAVGIPAIWLIRNQLDRLAWARVEQGQRALLALYQAQEGELQDLANLFAQRPTLQQYLRESLGEIDRDSLTAYMETLKSGAGVDLVLLCITQQPIASTYPGIVDDACSKWDQGAYHVIAGTPPQIWLAAAHPLGSSFPTSQIIVAMHLDDDHARRLFVETGMDHTIWADALPAASSFESGSERNPARELDGAVHGFTPGNFTSTFEHLGQPYYAVTSPLTPAGIHAETALNVAEIVSTQRNLVTIMVFSILVVAVFVSGLGVYLSRRISGPLVQLAEVAETFRQGDLGTPVVVHAGVREVAQVARALESARADLQRAMISLESEKAWVNQIIESIVEGIMTLDQDGQITYFSKGAERITGWRRDDVLGRPCDELFCLPESSASFSQSVRETGSRTKLLVELSGCRVATLAVTRAPLASREDWRSFGNPGSQSVLVFRDVSEGELLHRILGNFLANIAHEFRTPLSSAAASVELLIDQAPELSYSELQELLFALHLGILGLGTLVDNLLECASIEAGRFQVSPRQCDLGEIITRACQTMQPLLNKYGQQLCVSQPAFTPRVYADARRIEQVLINLLSNASKYGPADAEILVAVDVMQEWIKIKVVDRGPGVSREYREHIFHMVTYPGTVDKNALSGAGLGLMVVKAVVEAHGGQVGLQDNPGGGSTFWFTLPNEAGLIQEGV